MILTPVMRFSGLMYWRKSPPIEPDKSVRQNMLIPGKIIWKNSNNGPDFERFET